MIKKTAICGPLALGLLAVAVATPAQAAPGPVKAECSANKPGWAEPRVFTVSFERTSNSFKSIEVDEQQRVFTPTDAAAIYTAGKRGGVIVDVPSQRPGKWTGKPNGEVDEFALRTKDGGASFTLAPDGSDTARKRLTWKAEMTGQDGESLSAQGDGSCRVESAAEIERPAPPVEPAASVTSAAPEVPKASPAVKAPRKEIRLFGGRRGGSANSGEAK